MNWNELVDAVAARTGQPKALVRAILNAATAEVGARVATGDEVRLKGLGTLTSRWQNARTLRAVHDARKIALDGRWVPRFRSSAALRGALLLRSPQRWRDPRHQAAWRLAEALIGDLELYHGRSVPRLDEDTPLPMVAPICEVAFGPVWDRVLRTWNEKIPEDVRRDGQQLLRVAHLRWRA